MAMGQLHLKQKGECPEGLLTSSPLIPSPFQKLGTYQQSSAVAETISPAPTQLAKDAPLANTDKLCLTCEFSCKNKKLNKIRRI